MLPNKPLSELTYLDCMLDLAISLCVSAPSQASTLYATEPAKPVEPEPSHG